MLFPQMHSLVQETYKKMARELSWLHHNTQKYDNPVLKHIEELRSICIRNGINNPILGEK